MSRHSGIAQKAASSRFADNRSDKILARNRLRIIIHNRSSKAEWWPTRDEERKGRSFGVVAFHTDSSWIRKG